ncbi:MAG: hypothetical protein WBN94_02025 [Methanothrix sp.]
MYLEIDVAQTWMIAIWSKQIYSSVKPDLNMAAHWGGIVIMGNKEECKIPRIYAMIIEGGDKTL